MKRRNIALYGNKETGKSTYSKWLVSEFGYKLFSFADGVREVTAQVVNTMAKAPVPWQETYEYMFLDKERYNTYKETTFEYYDYTFVDGMRDILKGVGNGARDIIGKDVWVDAMGKKLGSHSSDIPYVIDDCRYPNEAGSQQNIWGATVAYLDKPGSDTDHPSEMCEKYVKEGLVNPDQTLPYADGIEATKSKLMEIIR